MGGLINKEALATAGALPSLKPDFRLEIGDCRFRDVANNLKSPTCLPAGRSKI